MNNPEQGCIQDIREFYGSVIHCLPHVVYVLNEEGHITDCNANFKNLVKIGDLKDFSGTPYKKMAKSLHLSDQEITKFQEHDRLVIFSGKSVYGTLLEVQDPETKNVQSYICNRDPLINKHNKVMGLLVFLQQADGINVTSQKSQTTPKESTRKPRILIVDDNEICLEAEACLFKDEACDVDCAKDEKEALKLFQVGKYDLILMDINFIETNGWVITKQFRKLEKDTKFHAPIIAVTSSEPSTVESDCKYYELEGAIKKPIYYNQVHQIVDNFIEHKDTDVEGLKRIE